MAGVPGSYVPPDGGTDNPFEQRSYRSISDGGDDGGDTNAAKNVHDRPRCACTTPVTLSRLVTARHVTDQCHRWNQYGIHEIISGIRKPYARRTPAQAALQELGKGQKPHRMAIVPVDEEDGDSPENFQRVLILRDAR